MTEMALSTTAAARVLIDGGAGDNALSEFFATVPPCTESFGARWTLSVINKWLRANVAKV